MEYVQVRAASVKVQRQCLRWAANLDGAQVRLVVLLRRGGDGAGLLLLAISIPCLGARLGRVRHTWEAAAAATLSGTDAPYFDNAAARATEPDLSTSGPGTCWTLKPLTATSSAGLGAGAARVKGIVAAKAARTLAVYMAGIERWMTRKRWRWRWTLRSGCEVGERRAMLSFP